MSLRSAVVGYWCSSGAGLVAFALLGVGFASNPTPRLAPRATQPRVEIDHVHTECRRDGDCISTSPCGEGYCSVGWCNWSKVKEFEPPSQERRCFLGRELTLSQVASECGAQILEGNVASNGAINDFNLRSCPPDDMDSCRQQREAGLRRQLRQDAETLARCIAADPALGERYIATRLPWDQTHPSGAYIDDTPLAASTETAEAPAETTEAQPTSGESESDAPSRGNNIGRGDDLRDESILEHTYDTQ